jgi:hypothetical protein
VTRKKHRWEAVAREMVDKAGVDRQKEAAKDTEEKDRHV